MRNPDNKFNWRGFTSLVTTIAFLVLTVSGVVLFFKPSGRVARWTDWSLMGLDKEAWGSLHVSLAVLFLAAIVFHIVYNWRVLLRYLKDKSRGSFTLGRELLVSLTVGGLFVAGSVMQVPPFSSLDSLRENIKYHWESPPGGRGTDKPADRLELTEVASRLGLEADEVVSALTANGLVVSGPGATVGEVAAANNLPVAAVSEAVYLVHGRRLEESHEGTGIRGQGGGRGFGRMSLAELCEQHEISLEHAVRVLEGRGVRAGGGSSLREIADSLGTTPGMLLEIIGKEA